MTDSIKKSLYWDFDVKRQRLCIGFHSLKIVKIQLLNSQKHDIDNNTVEKIMLRKKRLLKLYDTIMAE